MLFASSSGAGKTGVFFSLPAPKEKGPVFSPPGNETVKSPARTRIPSAKFLSIAAMARFHKLRNLFSELAVLRKLFQFFQAHKLQKVKRGPVKPDSRVFRMGSSGERRGGKEG